MFYKGGGANTNMADYCHRIARILVEQMQDLRLVRKEWQIVTTIDLTTFHRQIDRVTSPQHETILTKCCDTLTKIECVELLRVHSIQTMKRQIIQLNQHLSDLFSAPETKPINLRGRGVPPLAIIRSINGSLFGLMDYNDYQHITKEIDRLYQSQKEITSIVNNSTHINRSKVEDVVNYLKQTNKNIVALTTVAGALQNQLNREDHQIKIIEYTLQLSRAGMEAESTIRKMLVVTEGTVKAIDAAKHGVISHTLITPEQMHDVSESIKSVHPELEFPIPMGATDYAALSKISTVRVAHARRKLLAIITLPLLRLETYRLYQFPSCKRPQIIGNRTVWAHITPEKPYLLVAEDRHHFALLHQMDMEGCAPLDNRLVCIPRFTISNSLLKPMCEIMLLLKPSSEILRSCDVKISNSRGTEWTLLENDAQWLFSTNEPERGEVICSHHLVGTINIAGTEIVSLGPGCKRQTTSDLLTYIGILQTSEAEIHLPPVNLTLLDLAPELERNSESHNSLLGVHVDPLPNLKDHDRSEMQLDEAQRRLVEIGQRHQEAYHHRLLTFGSLGGLGLLSLGGIAYFLLRWKGFLNILRCICKTRMNKAEVSKDIEIVRRRRVIRSNSLPEVRQHEIIYERVQQADVAQDQHGSNHQEEITRPSARLIRPVTLVM